MSVTLMPPLKRGRYNIARLGLRNVVGLMDANQLQKALKLSFRSGLNALVVNLRGAKDVDKAGWVCLVSAARRLRRGGGHAILRHCSEDLYAQLQANHWDRVFLVPERRADDAALLPVELQTVPDDDASGAGGDADASVGAGASGNVGGTGTDVSE